MKLNGGNSGIIIEDGNGGEHAVITKHVKGLIL